jgi:hypothetical protein
MRTGGTAQQLVHRLCAVRSLFDDVKSNLVKPIVVATGPQQERQALQMVRFNGQMTRLGVQGGLTSLLFAIDAKTTHHHTHTAATTDTKKEKQVAPVKQMAPATQVAPMDDGGNQSDDAESSDDSDDGLTPAQIIVKELQGVDWNPAEMPESEDVSLTQSTLPMSLTHYHHMSIHRNQIPISPPIKRPHSNIKNHNHPQHYSKEWAELFDKLMEVDDTGSLMSKTIINKVLAEIWNGPVTPPSTIWRKLEHYHKNR